MSRNFINITLAIINSNEDTNNTIAKDSLTSSIISYPISKVYSKSYFKSASMLTASNKNNDLYNHISRLHEVTATTSSYKTPWE